MMIQMLLSAVGFGLLGFAGYWAYLHHAARKTKSDARHHSVRSAAPPLATNGPGGPIVILTSSLNPFSRYLSEILLNEGLNEFAIQDITLVTASSLKNYDVAILGEIPISPTQRRILVDWIERGGNLIAMRPAMELASMLGCKREEGVVIDGYLAINAATRAGKGLVSDTIQFHGQADLYPSGLDDPGMVATLYRDSITPTQYSAITTHAVGKGRVTIFAYDLARSIVYTRQGNPAWSGMERDGIPPIRSDDLFYGAASWDKKPDWVNLDKVAIPQADEQQRLLAKLILESEPGGKPLPRFWYFPRGLRAVVVMTGDDHGHGGTVGRFKKFQAQSPDGCSLDDWQCVRGTSNIFPGSIRNDEAQALVDDGFEIGLHVFTNCKDWPPEDRHTAANSIASTVSFQQSSLLYSEQLTAFARLYPHVPPPSTGRIDCVTWSDFDTQPRVELQHGIRFDTNYYFWPAEWVRNRPGMFTGSGMPMRFATRDGAIIDVYQAATQMTDESAQSYPLTINTLLDNALGPREFYGAFTANMHTDKARSTSAAAIIRSAKARNVPIVSAVQMLRWLDGRDGSSFRNIRWTTGNLHFTIAVADGSEGLTALLPTSSTSGPLAGIAVDGRPVEFEVRTFAGEDYAFFPAAPGSYDAKYEDSRKTLP
jgi:hypothetical protein